MNERIITCTDGVQISITHWSSSTSEASCRKRIVLLHGWLDNIASFHILAPQLQKDDVEIISIDLPGHGRSGHKSADGPPQSITEYVYYLSEVLSQLQWISIENNNKSETINSEVTLIGHSMGAAISVIYAAAFPEFVKQMVLLDGAGPLHRNTQEISRHIRKAVSQRISSNYHHVNNDNNTKMNNISHNDKRSNTRRWIEFEDAVKARINTAKLSPGKQYISKEAAEALVERATISQTPNSQKEQLDTNLVSFCHDSRLKWPSMQYFTKEQVHALYDDIQCPVCLITAKDGWPVSASIKDAIKTKLKPLVHKELPGSHHFHADPDTASNVANEVISFLYR